MPTGRETSAEPPELTLCEDAEHRHTHSFSTRDLICWTFLIPGTISESIQAVGSISVWCVGGGGGAFPGPGGRNKVQWTQRRTLQHKETGECPGLLLCGSGGRREAGGREEGDRREDRREEGGRHEGGQGEGRHALRCH